MHSTPYQVSEHNVFRSRPLTWPLPNPHPLRLLEQLKSLESKPKVGKRNEQGKHSRLHDRILSIKQRLCFQHSLKPLTLASLKPEIRMATSPEDTGTVPIADEADASVCPPTCHRRTRHSRLTDNWICGDGSSSTTPVQCLSKLLTANGCSSSTRAHATLRLLPHLCPLLVRKARQQTLADLCKIERWRILA